ncbi:MAG: arginine--tRNA ligase [Acidobacteriota bacterium]
MVLAVRAALEALLQEELSLRGFEVSPRVEVPPRRELGDLAWAGALALAKSLGKPPRGLAQELAQSLEAKLQQAEGPLGLLEPKVSVEGPGFLNFHLRRGPVVGQALQAGFHETPERPAKIIVEHTNINPNKAAHIGHLRNAVLGDVLARCLRFLGYPVEVQNYIDDTGVQVADVVVGFVFLPEAELLEAVRQVWSSPSSRREVLEEFAKRKRENRLVVEALGEADFDDLCWQLYPQVTRWYEQNPEASAKRTEVLHALEGGAPENLSLEEAVAALAAGNQNPQALARLGAAVAETNLRCHLLTMGRLGVAYDVLPHESDILRRGFWQRAFELLQEAGCIRKETEGKNAGCWVMSLADSPEFAGMADADKILVRSNGTVTYTGKDIAYQLWKLGLLRDPDGTCHDFGYVPFARFHQDGPAAPVRYGEGPRVLFRTSADPNQKPENASFGRGQKVYNVIDVRQSYPQKVVKEAVRALGFPESAENSIHFAYEMVALTPKAVHQLEAQTGTSFGLTPEEEKKPFVEMSGRRGLGVKADELLTTLVVEAKKAIRERLPEGESPADLESRARDIAVGALRYQMARQGRNRVLAFDFAEALAFEGDTGPYLQYSAVRAKKIFEKLAQAGLAGSPEEDAAALAGTLLPNDLWELAFSCLRTPEVVEKAVASLEFSLLAGHARELAQTFHNLYHRYPVLHAENEQERAVRRAVFRLFLLTITTILEELLGIPVPTEM